jgi:hypothetical protein
MNTLFNYYRTNHIMLQAITLPQIQAYSDQKKSVKVAKATYPRLTYFVCIDGYLIYAITKDIYKQLKQKGGIK